MRQLWNFIRIWNKILIYKIMKRTRQKNNWKVSNFLCILHVCLYFNLFGTHKICDTIKRTAVLKKLYQNVRALGKFCLLFQLHECILARVLSKYLLTEYSEHTVNMCIHTVLFIRISNFIWASSVLFCKDPSHF